MYSALFRLTRPRHPLLRAFSTLLGVLVVGAALVFGFFAVIALVSIGAIVWSVRQFSRPATAQPFAAQSTKPVAPDGVIEGEFVVVRDEISQRRG